MRKPRENRRRGRSEGPQQQDKGRRPGRGRRHHRQDAGERQGPPQMKRNRQNQFQERRRNRRRPSQPRYNTQSHGGGIDTPHNRRHHGPGGRANPGGNRRRRRSNWRPAAGFYMYEDRFEIVVELPGVAQDNVSVSTTDKFLIVKGKKPRRQTDEKPIIRRSKIRYGRFHHAFPFPPNAKRDAIKAELKDGVLTIAISKKEEAKPTEIPINSAE